MVVALRWLAMVLIYAWMLQNTLLSAFLLVVGGGGLILYTKRWYRWDIGAMVFGALFIAKGW